MNSKIILATLVVLAAGASVNVGAQTANAGADINRAARANDQESDRTERIDKPIRTDPVGNSILTGVATGVVRGVEAGVVTAVRGAVVGSAVQATKDAVKRQNEAVQRQSDAAKRQSDAAKVQKQGDSAKRK